MRDLHQGLGTPVCPFSVQIIPEHRGVSPDAKKIESPSKEGETQKWGQNELVKMRAPDPRGKVSDPGSQ